MFSSESKFSDWAIHGFNGAPALLLSSTESTHSLMKQLAGLESSSPLPPGSLIVADSQSAGKGRHDRTWASPAGLNLYFNILIPLKGIPLNQSPQITQVASLTFAEVFKSIQEDSNQSGCGDNSLGKITVKWPNDILCGKSKFCGILAEILYTKSAQTKKLEPALNMGVGINVNSTAKDYAFLGRAVTTLKDIAGHSLNREKLLQMLIGNLERAIGQFKAFGLSPWVNAWKQMDQFIGGRGTIIINNHCTDENRNGGNGVQKKSGRILDMQPDGSLLFQCDDGSVETVYSADLEI